MPAFLRFLGAREHDPAIEQWLDSKPGDLGAIARTWFNVMRRCGGDVRGLMHDGFATACVKDAPFAYVGVFKAHVNIGFFHGAALPDPSGLLEGKGKFMRHVQLRAGFPILDAPLTVLIDSAYRDIVAKLRTAELVDLSD